MRHSGRWFCILPAAFALVILILTGEGCGNKAKLNPPPLPKPEPVKNLSSETRCGRIIIKWMPSVFDIRGKPLEEPATYLIMRRRGDNFRLKPPEKQAESAGTPTGSAPPVTQTPTASPTPEATASPAPGETPRPSGILSPEYEFKLIAIVQGQPINPNEQGETLSEMSFEDTGLPGAAFQLSERFKKPSGFPPKPSDEDQGLLYDYSYFYKVHVVGPDRSISDPSNVAEIRYEPNPLQMDALEYQASESGVKLRWEPPFAACNGLPVPELGSYYLERSSGANPDQFLVLSVVEDPAVLSFTDTTFLKDSVYYYRIGAITRMGKIPSPPSVPVEVSTEDSYPPGPVQNLRLALGQGGVLLIWDPGREKDIRGYKIFRSESPEGPFTALEPPQPILNPTFSDKTVRPGKYYSYYVVAVDDSKRANESSPSAIRTIQVP